MNFQKMQYFVAVAEHLNFTEAAKSLYMTQPSLSRQIADLEDELGLRLLKRTKRSVSLTPEGEVFLKEARDIIKRRDELVRRAHHRCLGATGVLRVGYWEIVDYELMSQTIRRLTRQSPLLQVEPVKNNFGILMQDLREGKLDLVYTANVKLDNIPWVLWSKVGRSKLQLVVPSDHPLAGRASVSADELAEEKFIKMARRESPISTDYIIQLCNRHGFSPNIVQEPADLESTLILVSAGCGVAILASRLQQKTALQNLRFIDIDDPDTDMSVDLVWRKDDQTPSVALFIEAAKEVIAARYGDQMMDELGWND